MCTNYLCTCFLPPLCYLRFSSVLKLIHKIIMQRSCTMYMHIVEVNKRKGEIQKMGKKLKKYVNMQRKHIRAYNFKNFNTLSAFNQ